MSFLKAYIFNLNLFKSTDATNDDEHQNRSNVLATRIYLVVLILALIGLALGLGLTLQTRKIETPHPSKEEVKALPIDAQCPCSRLSISYGEFITLEASFHQVCSSDFVSDRWIEAIFSVSNWNNSYPADFRTSGSAQFQVLASLCRLSEKNVRDSLISFYATSLVGSQVLSETLLKSTVQASIKQFQSTMYNAFQSQLQLVSKMTFGNQLISGLQTSIVPTYVYSEFIGHSFESHWPISYKSENESYCYCTKDYNCRKSSGIYNTFEFTIDFVMFSDLEVIPLVEIPGFFVGCMPLNSLLQSTLECFYNQTCLNKILPLISTNKNFTAMALLEQSRFKPNSTVQAIINRTMVEQWTENISYDKYFAQCAPISCIYSKVERRDSMFVLTEVIGLLGGLVSVLTFIIPAAVRFIRRSKLRNTEATPRIPRK
jgi:hypothetical protein